MRHILAGFSLIFFSLTYVFPGYTQNGNTLFQQALVKERTEGDLKGAIAIYQDIIENYSVDRSLVARSLLEMGKAYEKMGRDEAIKAYQQVIENYRDQTPSVSEAQQRLSLLQQRLVTTTAQEPASETIVRKLLELDGMGRPSPDGRYISYVNWAFGNLAIYDRRTGERRDLTTSGSWEAGRTAFSDVSIWSPDSKQIAYFWYDEQGGHLKTIDATGENMRVLVPFSASGTPWPVDWSHDGRHIVAVNENVNHISDSIILVDAVDGSMTPLNTLPDSVHTLHMSFSIDDRFIAYERKEPGTASGDIYVLSRDGTLDEPLISHPAHDWGPEWSPDGRYLIFISDRSGRNALWKVPVSEGRLSGEPELIVEGIASAYHPKGFTADGIYYYAVNRPGTDLFTAQIDTTNGTLSDIQKPPLRYAGVNTSPVWSPDGSKLAFISRRMDEGGDVPVIYEFETGREQELPAPDPLIERPLGWASMDWSPDNRHLLISAGNTVKKFFLIDVESGVAQEIQDLNVASGLLQSGDVPAWKKFTPDGEAILYELHGRIIRTDLETDSTTILRDSTRYVYRLSPSPDGKYLAFFEGNTVSESAWQKDLILYSLDDQTSRVIWEGTDDTFFSWNAGISWLPDGRTLILGTFNNEVGQQLYLVNALTGQRTPLGSPRRGINQLGDIAGHPSEFMIAYSRGFRVQEYWTIENLVE